MFVDRARIRVTAGGGGNGCCSFRREKFVPRGGPDGGDGGNGGDVLIVASSRYATLQDLRYHAHVKAKRGDHGKGSNCHGKNAPDTIIDVPPGTLIRDFETGDLLADLIEDGECFRAARGGRGGKGNARFATSTNKAPRFAELGEPGEEAEFLLELKLIAQVGLVGLPNAGKSTFLSQVTAATPKVADYPFTTLTPNLGVAELSDHRTLTIADIPGIIEGAAEGKGLGHDFLRHIERTRVLLFLIDLGDADPVETRRTLEEELEQHSPAFARRPRVFALNKADVTENRARFDQIAAAFPDPWLISAATGEGIAPLLEALWTEIQQLESAANTEDADDDADATRDYTYEAPYEIEQTAHGFEVTGRPVERTVRMTNFDNEEAVRHMQKKLERMGLFKALKRLGANEGDTILVGGIELEYHAD